MLLPNIHDTTISVLGTLLVVLMTGALIGINIPACEHPSLPPPSYVVWVTGKPMEAGANGGQPAPCARDT